MSDCLVTGGSGFIGRALIAELGRRGRFDRVVNLDRSAEGGRTDIASPIDFDPGDHDFEACLHLAALAKEPGYEDDEYYQVNDEGTGHVLDLCDSLDIGSMVFASTTMVYAAGTTRHGEPDPVDPDTAYGCSKARAEDRVRTWAAADQSRRIRVVRPGVVFGPGDLGNFNRLRVVLSRRLFFYVGRRDTVKSCIHLDDVVSHLIHLVDDTEGHEVIHSVIPRPTTIEEVVDGMFDAFGGRYRVPTVPYPLAHAASRPFEWLTRLGFDTGIHRRRIEKLHRSTNLAADRLEASSFTLAHRTVADGLAAWADAE